MESNLGRKIATLKTGDEPLVYHGTDTGFRLLDYWQWSASDIVSNATRGIFAEFIVASALHLDTSIPRDEWSALDITSPKGTRIEVKSSAYLQSWTQSAPSKIRFSIRPARATGNMEEKPTRQSDAYVFCFLKHLDKDTLNPLNLDQWDFYVLATKDIDGLMGKSTSISLNSVRKLATAVPYAGLREAIMALT